MTASEGSGCYPAVRAREWGKIASNVPDPPQCIDNCGRKFLEKLVPGFRDSKWTEACGILSQTENTKQLWDLYCCNSSICGVFPSMGQDPGVNYIVNTCHNNGIRTVQDPGPPPLEYDCSAVINYAECSKPFFQSDSRPSTSEEGFWATSAIVAKPSSTSTTAMVSTSSSHSALTSGASTSNQSHGKRPSGSLPLGSKIAIGISCGIVLIAIIAIAICIWRRRPRRGYTQSIKNEIKHPSLPQASSPTPLISSEDSTHDGTHHTTLTPPPRLKERNLLPSLISTTTSEAGGSFPGTPVSYHGPGGFPQSPFADPVSARLAQKGYRSSKPPVSPLSSSFHGKSIKTVSIGSAASNRTTTTVSNISSAFPYPSPSRPPRPHDTPLRIPDLVCPGPPPTRALPPPPPPVSPVSPISPVSPTALFRQQSIDVGHNVSLALAAGFIPPRNPARGVVLGKDSKDFCDLTERCARESRDRDSWGSWSFGGGVTSIGTSSVQRGGAARVNSPVLEEADLERMGGKY
ncbi:hypothetical protein CCHR01_07441 [Colletotrichum chrysophilum]|uniref:Uncharacterized protein n=1 Tax=Colletotrichum chrysophilum TaxID=1836956 RepID=A0AAD9AL69_9PEZI|nr:hypothetical protein CCHR01_07441 [Colletotrichum chrysophilum]